MLNFKLRYQIVELALYNLESIRHFLLPIVYLCDRLMRDLVLLIPFSDLSDTHCHLLIQLLFEYLHVFISDLVYILTDLLHFSLHPLCLDISNHLLNLLLLLSTLFLELLTKQVNISAVFLLLFQTFFILLSSKRLLDESKIR
jgi:hypothetical protein